MHQNKQSQTSFVCCAHQTTQEQFVFCCCDGEGERRNMQSLNDEEAAVEIFSYFTYVNVVIPQCASSVFNYYYYYYHQNVVKVSNVKGLFVQNGSRQFYIITSYIIGLLLLMDYLSENSIVASQGVIHFKYFIYCLELTYCITMHPILYGHYKVYYTV